MSKTVFLKSSGELLTDKSTGHLWTPNGVRNITEKIARAHRAKEALGVTGLVVISGAGNIIRGDALRKEGLADKRADLLGRLATLQNLLIMQEAFDRQEVGSRLFVAKSNEFADTVCGKLPPCTPEGIAEAHADGLLALIAFGTGEDDKSTDSAVCEHAAEYVRAFGGEVVVLKGTKHDGIYDKDPDIFGDALRYDTISAQEVLDDYNRLGGVDMPSLRTLIASGLSMRVYKDSEHDLHTVLSGENGVGTLIVGRPE